MTVTARRVAVIGCGDISVLHFAAIAALASAGIHSAELVGVVDPDVERRAAASAAHNVPGFASHLELFDAVHPDVVHICTPHHLHASIAIDALERGIHVIMEKPLAHTREEGDRVVEAAERGNAKIAVCFQNRYNLPVQAAHDLLVSGELGAVLGASATVMWHRTAAYYESRPWRGQWATGGGGLLMNQAIHTLDLLQWLVGPVTQVRGNASTRALDDVIEVEDTAELMLTHENGARSVFYATLANAVNAPITVDIVAERGTLSLQGDLTVTHGDGRVDVVKEKEIAAGNRAYWGISHELLIADFYARLDDDAPFWISPLEAQKTLEIIQEVYDQSYPERAGHANTNNTAAATERNAVS